MFKTKRLVLLPMVAVLAIFLGIVQLAGAQQLRPAGNSANLQAYLTKEVRHVLVMQPYYTVFDNLAFQIEGSKVILIGQVTQPVLKEDAEKSVKQIEGVESVDDRIEVLPLSPMDDQIRRAEYRSIYSFPSLSKYSMQTLAPLHIIVKNGHVSLEGVVDNQADKDAAGIRANGVSGVFSVTNNLQVVSGSEQKGQ